MLCRVGYLMAQSGGVRPALDLNFLAGTLPSVVTFSRASAATDSFYTDAAGSSFNSYSSGVARLLASGYLSEEVRTNSVLNSTAPATQTTGSLSTGTYALWCIGTGSVTSSAGTATATGLGLCSPGTFQMINVTVAGTLVLTVSGSLNRFQLERGNFPDSFIVTAGATATRAADVATVALSATGIPASPSGLTVLGKFTSPSVFDTTKTYSVLQLDDGTNNNRVLLRFAPSANSPLQLIPVIGGVSQPTITLQTSAPTATVTKFWFALSPGNSAAQIIGQTKVTDAGATPLPSGLTTLRIGEQISTLQFNSSIARLQFWSSRLSDAQAATLAAGL